MSSRFQESTLLSIGAKNPEQGDYLRLKHIVTHVCIRHVEIIPLKVKPQNNEKY